MLDDRFQGRRIMAEYTVQPEDTPKGGTLLTAKEISIISQFGKRAILKRAQNESWPFIEETGRGGKIRKYFLTGLPEEIQLLYNKDTKSGEKLPTDGHTTPLNGTISRQGGNGREGDGELPPPDSLPKDTSLSSRDKSPSIYNKGRDASLISLPSMAEWQSNIASARYDLVTDYISAKNRAKNKKKKGKASICRASGDFLTAYNTGLTHPELYKVLGSVARGTIEKWCKTLKTDGYDLVSLAPRHGQHLKGRTRVTDEEMKHLLLFALNPNQMRISAIIRFAKSVMAKAGIPSASSDATLRRALMDWRDANMDRWIFCRKGEKALDDEVLPYIERDSSLLEVGDVLVADGHTLNFHVLNPFTGRPVRATLLMFYDWASRYPAGWYIMTRENTQCIHAALRRAILALGKIPKWVHLDNGKAFRAKFFTQTPDFEQAGIRGLYARLGIQTHFATPYNAKDKVVERFFGTFNELERLLPSYTGQSIDDKPAYMHRNERLHKKLHNPYIPTIQQMDTIISAWVRDEYGMREHRGLNGTIPADVWQAGKGPGVDEAGLRYLMMSHEVKNIHRNGITLFGVNYYDEALYGYRKKVSIKYDILNLEKIYVYSEDGTSFICEATPVRSAHPLAKLTGQPLDLETVQQLKLKKHLKKKTEKECREAAASIGPWNFPAIENIPTPMTQAKKDEIQQAAAQVEVIDIETQRPDMPLWDGDVYERLLMKRAHGSDLSDDEMRFMVGYEKSAPYRMLKPYYEDMELSMAAQAQAAQ